MNSYRRLLCAAASVLALAAPAAAGPVFELEVDGTATNNTLVTAQAIAASSFTLPVPGNVFDPPGYRTATVSGAGNGDDVDFFSFTAQGGNAYFDIDTDPLAFDSIISVFNSSGTLIAFDDDSFPEDPGTGFGFDAFVGVLALPGPGTYYVAVSRFANFANATFTAPLFTPLVRPDGAFGGQLVTGATPGDSSFPVSGNQVGTDYTLHLSVQQVPEPASLLLLGAGLAGLAARRMRR